MLRSLRARLLLASVLWTAGLLAVFHVLSILILHIYSRAFRMNLHVPVAVGLFLMAAGVLGLRRGLLPFRELRERLNSVRAGTSRKLEGLYPLEVQPLVDDLNALLEDREKAVKRAQATAGDLAHGLKTPLAILAQEAERAEAAGNTELAHGIGQQVERMRRQVDYHLARARAASSGASPSARCFVAASAEGLARTMLRLHDGRGLAIDVQVDAHHVVRVQREDLDEMLGNLLDNACKWGRSKVRVGSTQVDGFVEIGVNDDGPGIANDLRSIVMQRGVRADESALGSGLGLAIVRDLAEVYGGSVELQDSALGGLMAVLRLPGA